MHECEDNRGGWMFLNFETDFECVLEQNCKNIIKWKEAVYLDWASFVSVMCLYCGRCRH